MSDPFRDNPLPTGPILGAGVLVAFALAAVLAVRLGGFGASQADDAAAIATRELRFADQADGSIAVYDAQTRRQIDVVLPGTSGFLRGTLRGLARERRRSDIGQEPPFQLVARADGRLTLIDPATGRRIDLESFGPANTDAFARYLPKREATVQGAHPADSGTAFPRSSS
jgi:putative photosynthetic complex assembly protein